MISFLVELLSPIPVRAGAAEMNETVPKSALGIFAATRANQRVPILDGLNLELTDQLVKFSRNQVKSGVKVNPFGDISSHTTYTFSGVVKVNLL